MLAAKRKTKQDKEEDSHIAEEECQNAQVEYCYRTCSRHHYFYDKNFGEHRVSSLPDTGAFKFLINKAFANKCCLTINPIEPTVLRQAGHTILPVLGSTTFTPKLESVTTTIKPIIGDNLHKNLLISWQALIKLKDINPSFPAQIEETGLTVSSDQLCAVKEKIICQFHDTLSDDLSPDPMEISGKAIHIYLYEHATPSQTSIARLMT